MRCCERSEGCAEARDGGCAACAWRDVAWPRDEEFDDLLELDDEASFEANGNVSLGDLEWTRVYR